MKPTSAFIRAAVLTLGVFSVVAGGCAFVPEEHEEPVAEDPDAGEGEPDAGDGSDAGWSAADFEHEFRILEVIRDGGTVADAYEYRGLRVTFPSPGTRLMEVGASIGPIVYTREETDTHLLEQDDRNTDGNPDYRRDVETADGGFRSVVESDDDYDGTFESRTTTELTGDDMLQVTVEALTAPDGGPPQWSTVSSELRSRVAGKGGDGCFGGLWATDTSSSASLPGLPNVRVIVGSDPSACSATEASKILQGLADMLKEGLACIERGNRKVSSSLRDLLARATIDVSCSELDSVDACAELGSAGGKSYRILFDHQEAKKTCNGSTVIHELLHNAGFNHPRGFAGQESSEMDACARACTRCETCAAGNERRASEKCARCYDGLAKWTCGSKRVAAPMDCKDKQGPGPFACEDTVNVFFNFGTACTQILDRFCDDSRANDTVYGTCVDTCPNGYTNKEDCALILDDFENSDSCNEFPAFCNQ